MKMKMVHGLLLGVMLFVTMSQPAQSWAANVASGKSYQLNAAPYYGESANHKDDTGPEAFVDKDTWYRGELTNGAYTTANYFGNCVHLTQQGPISIIVDLRGVYSVTIAKLQACGGGRYGMYYPKKIEVYGLETPGSSMPFDQFVATTASDNQSWTKLGELVTNEVESGSDDSGTEVIKNFEIAFSAANCRLIKFVLTDRQCDRGTSSMNLGEVEVYSTSTPTLDPSNTVLVTFPSGGRNAYFPLEFSGINMLKPKVFETILYDDFENGTLDTTKWTDESSGGTVTVASGHLTVQANVDQLGQVRSKSTGTILNATESLVLSSTEMTMNDWGLSSSFGLSDASGLNQIRIGTMWGGARYFGVQVIVNGVSQTHFLRNADYFAGAYTITWSADKVTLLSASYGLWFDSSDPNKNGGGAAWSLPAMGTQMAVLAYGGYQSGWTRLEDVKLSVKYSEFRVAGGVSADMADCPWSAQRVTAQIIKDENGMGAEGTAMLKSLGIRALRFWDVIWVNYRSHIEQVKVRNFTTGDNFSIPADDNDYAYPYYNEILDYCAKNDFACTIVVDTYYYDPVGDYIYNTPEVGATDPNDPNSLVCKAAQRNVAPIVQYYKDHGYTNDLIIEIGNECIGYVGPDPNTRWPTAQQYLNIIKVYATTIKNIDPNVGTTIYPWPDDGIYQLVGSADIGDLIDYAVRHPYPPRIDPGSIKQDVTETKALLSSAGMDHVNLLMTEYSQDWGATNDAMSWTNAILQARLEMNMLANPDISGYYEFDLFQCAKLIYSNTDFWTARRYYADANRPTDDHPELGARYVKLPSGLVGGMFDNLAYDDIVKLWPGKNSDVYALMSNSDQGHKILLLNTSSSSIPLNWSSSFNVGSISTLTSTGEQFSHTLTQPWSINADPNSGINPNLVLAPKSMMLLTENPVLVKASLPTPANSGTGVSITPTLNWTGGGMLADSHDVYFGTNQTDVNNATTASAEFKGNQGGTTYVPETLSNNTTYYWRVDERHAAVVDDFEEGTLNLTKWTDESFGGGTATVTNGRLTVQSNGDYNNGQVRSKSTATIQNASETLVLSSTNVSMNDWGIGSSFGLSDASGNNQIRIGTLYSAGNRYFGVEVVVDGISQQDLIRSPSYITSSYTITWAAGKVTVQSQLYGLMFDSSDPNKNGGTAAWSLPAMGTQMAVLVFGSYQSGWTSLEDVKLAVSSDFTKGDVWSFTTETPPTFVAAGAVTSGTVTITPSLPASITTGDILLLFIETSNQAVSISNQNGGTWTQITNSPQYTGTAAGTTGVRLAAYWSRYNGTQGNPTISDSGNHQMGRIIAIRGAAASGDPWNVTAGGVEAASDTSGSIPGATTTATSTLVVVAIASALPDATGTSNFSNWINTDMASLTERTDNTVIAGNGGGIGIATDVMATAGAYSNTVVTLGSSSYKAMMSIAIKP